MPMLSTPKYFPTQNLTKESFAWSSNTRVCRSSRNALMYWGRMRTKAWPARSKSWHRLYSTWKQKANKGRFDYQTTAIVINIPAVSQLIEVLNIILTSSMRGWRSVNGDNHHHAHWYWQEGQGQCRSWLISVCAFLSTRLSSPGNTL